MLDPTTKEGREEIERRIKKRKREASEARERAQKDIESEPSGKLTSPNELDLMRDRKSE
ncbi:hypothetical protein [Marinibactrum halimedae]|uniref:Uncharacterized protein n=1 Tax=Marinibactrum halimedae TaxID=1444977 RepID=A0AA37T9G7_9GAMM|nr:hypothetical protein [Marinibactrum halimedae]MCD9460213.1 hypothetical protein [Marinibactrum halimedae]GLS27954.1 hypothetical protein GCM10007877_36730 [Marinibactrum halimedae]